MVTDQYVSTVSTRRSLARNGRWHRPLVVTASLTAAVAFLAWIAVLALTLPTRYLANNWNVTWVGFDVMLLIGLSTTGWAVATRRPWAGTALMVNAAMLVCDAWFDVTTASGATTTVVSIGLAAVVELPTAAGLAWAATRLPVGRRGRPIRTRPHQRRSANTLWEEWHRHD
jgi:hypothetical protein